MTHPSPQSLRPRRRGGFSLLEVLLAIFILSIGMIMVAAVFPVGANWTKQTTEESVGQAIAQNALSVIQSHYGPNGDLNAFLAPGPSNPFLSGANPPFRLAGLPNLTTIPANERSYQFGETIPFPSQSPQDCSYFWTAVCRLSPRHRDPAGAIVPSASYQYDVYVLVFRKAKVDIFGNSVGTLPTVGTSANYPGSYPGSYTEVANTRNGSAAPPEIYIPTIVSGPASFGTYNMNSSTWTTSPLPPVGTIGIGVDSGTVFRTATYFDTSSSSMKATCKPALIGQTSPTTVPTENMIFAPPADGGVVSPLIYVYQTTLTF